MRRLFFLVLAVVWTVGPVAAGTVGTTTADILKINQGARPAGMAGAYTALGDDAYSTYYNPAGLDGVKVPQLVLLHSDHLAYISYEYFTFAFPWGSTRALGANLTYRHTGSIDNPSLPGEPDNPAVSASDMLVSVTGSQNFQNKFAVGISGKFLNSRLAEYNASAFAVDLGVKMIDLPYNLKAGLSVQNLGTAMDFVKNDVDNIKDPLPLYIRFGAAWNKLISKKKDLNVGLDFFKPSDQPIRMALGAEFWLFEKLFAVRGGMKRDQITKDPGNVFHNYTLGFSLTRAFEGSDFTLDFAYNPASFELTTEDTYFVALNLRFNRLKIL